MQEQKSFQIFFALWKWEFSENTCHSYVGLDPNSKVESSPVACLQRLFLRVVFRAVFNTVKLQLGLRAFLDRGLCVCCLWTLVQVAASVDSVATSVQPVQAPACWYVTERVSVAWNGVNVSPLLSYALSYVQQTGTDTLLLDLRSKFHCLPSLLMNLTLLGLVVRI